jgi:CubicO group peptidase (beta-lactamase class C family)
MVKMSSLVLLFAGLVGCHGRDLPPATPVQPVAPPVDQAIHRVERGLLAPVVVRGEPGMTIAERMNHYRVPGVSIAIINHYAIEWARGYGTAEIGDSRPVGVDTLFQAASVSKPVAALGALVLVQRGRLGLDEDVNLKLTSWKVPQSPLTSGRPVTLRSLLSHSAGVTVHGFAGYRDGDEIPSLPELLAGERPSNSPPIRVDLAPATKYRYSGGGFCVMQQLVIDVADEPFPDIMDEAVFRPLGMAHSTYRQPLPDDLHELAASGHTQQGAVIPGRWRTYPEMAAAGLWTTASDLAHFGIELQRAKVGLPTRVLTPQMAAQMLSRQVGKAGLGIFIEGKGAESERFVHSGTNAGFRAMLVAYPSGQGAVILTNGDNGADLTAEILRSIAKEYGWSGYYREKAPGSAAMPGPADDEGYASAAEDDPGMPGSDHPLPGSDLSNALANW